VDSATVLLMLLAGLLHASWHALVKSGTGRLASLAGMGLVSGSAAACTLPFLGPPPAAVWPVLALSVPLHAGYKVALARAYDHGDLSQAYPLARGLVPIFAALIAAAVLHEVPAPGQAAGIAIVSAGVLALALEAGRTRPSVRLLPAAAAAGFTVAAYSVVDGYGVRAAGDWSVFTAWLIVLDTAAFLLLARALRGPRLWPELGANRWPTLISGLFGLGSFGVFLWALGRAPVGAVAALRETSVLFAAAIGMGLHRDPFTAWRAGAVLTISAGVATVAALH
jgi:drug/metabolite transporter (DMT)-like permease